MALFTDLTLAEQDLIALGEALAALPIVAEPLVEESRAEEFVEETALRPAGARTPEARTTEARNAPAETAAPAAGLLRLLAAVDEHRAEDELAAGADAVASRQLAETGQILGRYADLLR